MPLVRSVMDETVNKLPDFLLTADYHLPTLNLAVINRIKSILRLKSDQDWIHFP